MKLRLNRIVLPLAQFDLKVELSLASQVTAIFGPSGAGKTSLLDLVAGLRSAQSAFIQLDDRILTDTDAGIFVPARMRGIGYVPQDLALFPHYSVSRNIQYGRKAGQENATMFSLDHVLDTLELRPLMERGVQDLSGGEKQRVALARALLSSPRLLLLDEPLASLDSDLKARILPYLTRIRDEFRVPMLYVTHDREEALALCDDVVSLCRGRVIDGGKSGTA